MEQFLNKCLNQTEGIDLNNEQRCQIISYLLLLKKWNKIYNLTCITDPQEMITKHIMDSLIIGPYMTGSSFCDIGSGAGLPGIPLAIMYPDREFTLIDSRSKRTIFLTQVKMELKLNNVSIINQRAENITDLKFDGAFSRAFSSLKLFYSIGKKLLKEDGVIYAMKGMINQNEIEEVKDQIKKIITLKVPGEKCTRNLVMM